MSQGLGNQGGDLRHLNHPDLLDLSTCVNRYGPSPSALKALHGINAVTLRLHPFDADNALVEAYARCLNAPTDEFVAGRGIAEFIWRLAGTRDADSVAVPLPAYTDHIRAFPNSVVNCRRDPKQLTIDDVDQAMSRKALVVISNPNNPTGQVIDTGALADCCASHPLSMLVVDESYVEFCVGPSETTMIGSGVANVLALRSASKFYGIAATRAGVAWTRNEGLRDELRGRRGPWAVSGLDSRVACAALNDQTWAESCRLQLQRDGEELERLLITTGIPVSQDARVHFRLWHPSDASQVVSTLVGHGVAVRSLGAGHGFPQPVLRITAPRAKETERFSAALERTMEPAAGN